MSSRFDLDTSVAAWRRMLEHNPALSGEDVAELVQHLRDQVAAFTAEGLGEEEAYRRAMVLMGDYATAEIEYGKVYWSKRRRRGELLHELQTRTAMWKSYLKIAWRNVLREKSYAFINVFGLAVGIAFCVLINLYVRDELTFDHFHEQRDRIYRVYTTSNIDGKIGRNSAWLSMPQGPAMQAELPEVEQYVRFGGKATYFVRAGTKVLGEEVLFADASIFELFTFPLVQGDPQTALADPSHVVLTEHMARKYFGDSNPMGQRLSIRLADHFEDFVVTGVANEPPVNSSIRFGILLPFSRLMRLEPTAVDDWNWNGFLTYVLLERNTSIADLEEKLVAFRAKYFPSEARELREAGRWSGDGIPVRFRLQPLTDLHLNTEVSGDPQPSNPAYSFILGSIALVVLLIACINFTTLALGRSSRRAREIGVRKIVGAQRRQLMLQFWGEALVLSLLALGLGLGLAGLFLPVFNQLAGKALQFDMVGNLLGLLVLMGMMLVTALLAGSYPALVLSSLRPVDTLKNCLNLGGPTRLTRSLVVVQFALSVFLIVSTSIMLHQLRYVQTKDLGFDKEHMVVIPVQGLDGQRMLRLFQNELADLSKIAGITGINDALTHGYSVWGFKHREEAKEVYVYRGETNFLEVLGIELVEGRNFDSNRATDSTHAVIINEAMARDFGWGEPVGQVVSGLYPDDPSRDPTVIGVVKDFNFRSLHRPVEPMMVSLSIARINYLIARVRTGQTSAALAALQTTWEEVAPDMPFTYNFLDEELNGQYAAERRWSQIVSYGSFFAMLVACLGLFGLVSLTVARRTKEIGIRKVLGASVLGVMGLLSKDFLKLVGIALLVAAPLGYIVMQRWLEDFAYRIEIGPGIFILTGVMVLLIALLTVSYQSIKAALTDPVKSLRYE